MVKKLMPVIAVPDISKGMSSLMWGYINKPVALKNPKQKKSRDTSDKGVPRGIIARIIIVSTMAIEPAMMTHLRVLNSLSDRMPQQGAPEIIPTFKSKMRLPVVRAEYPRTSIK
jgi:hypothetical protein